MDSHQSAGSRAGEAQKAEPFQRRTVSFVHRDHKLGPQQQRIWDENRDALVMDVPRARATTSIAPGAGLDPERVFGREAPLVVEIGSGTGDAVICGALARPDTNFLAVEVYRPGLAATVGKIVEHGLTNVRLVQADAIQVLKHLLAPASVDEMWVFFADPWHKHRHHKRRLVNPGFADLAASRMVPGGTLRLATDWADYARQMRDVLDACASFTNPYGDALATAGGFAPRFGGRGMTRFEGKALEVGRPVFDLELRRA